MKAKDTRKVMDMGRAGKAGRQSRHRRLSLLFDAMERHGNAEGTETQLDDAEEFLRLAFDNMSPTQQTEFLDSPAVSEFITREGGNKEDANEPNV